MLISHIYIYSKYTNIFTKALIASATLEIEILTDYAFEVTHL
jgi:hypothetical protein